MQNHIKFFFKKARICFNRKLNFSHFFPLKKKKKNSFGRNEKIN
jgi:hypothetical protein